MPGRIEQIGEIILVIINGLINSFFFNLILSIFCGGSFVLDFIAKIRVGAPNSPDRRGRRGWFTAEFRFKTPKKPAKIKIINAFVLDSLLEMNNIIDAQRRINPMKGYEAE